MAKQKKPVHKVQMTEGKRDIIRMLLQEYDIESAHDIQDALKDLPGGTIKEMMETEYQSCLVHQVRNTLKYVADKDRKPFTDDLKTIYQASIEEKALEALEALERITEEWTMPIRDCEQKQAGHRPALDISKKLKYI